MNLQTKKRLGAYESRKMRKAKTSYINERRGVLAVWVELYGEMLIWSRYYACSHVVGVF